MRGTLNKDNNLWYVTSSEDWYWSPRGYRKRKRKIPVHTNYVSKQFSDGLIVDFESFINKSDRKEYAIVQLSDEDREEDVGVEEVVEEVDEVEEVVVEEVEEEYVEPPVVEEIIEEPKVVIEKNKTIKMETKNSLFSKSNLIRVTIICALLTQINHASSLFYLISDQTTFSFIMSWVFAVSLESSIYIFTMYGKRDTAIFFGFISWAVNILHFWFEAGFTQKFMAMNIISPIIPITIYYYSELIKEERYEKELKELYDKNV